MIVWNRTQVITPNVEADPSWHEPLTPVHVVHDHYDRHGQVAAIVLPATHISRRPYVVTSLGHLNLGWNEAAIEPVGSPSATGVEPRWQRRWGSTDRRCRGRHQRAALAVALSTSTAASTGFTPVAYPRTVCRSRRFVPPPPQGRAVQHALARWAPLAHVRRAAESLAATPPRHAVSFASSQRITTFFSTPLLQPQAGPL